MSQLYNSKALEKYILSAADGDLGSINDLYFDDYSWVIRYIVVNLSPGIKPREALVSPIAVGKILDDDKIIEIELTQQQITSSPPVEARKPVSRSYEERYYQYYNWPPYWTQNGSYNCESPWMSRNGFHRNNKHALTRPEENEHPRLCSMEEVKGYRIRAMDDEIGYVQEFIVDQPFWVIRYLVVDRHALFPGKTLLLSPACITHVNRSEKEVRVELSRDIIQSAPEYRTDQAITREYEMSLFKHYGLRAYWENG
jgi:hypothetical protein